MLTIDFTSRLRFDTFHKVMYGWDPDTVSFNEKSINLIDNCNLVSKVIGQRMMYPYPIFWKIPTKENIKYNASAKFIKDFAKKIIEEETKKIKLEGIDSVKAKEKKSMIEELLIASFEEEEEYGNKNHSLNEEELIDNVCILFFGAYDTTSNTLQFILYSLAKYPDYQEKLRTAIKEKIHNLEFLKNTDDKYLDKISDLTNLINEVNRLSSFVPAFERTAIKDTQILDYQIKKGTTILIDSESIGKVPEFFNNQTDLNDFRPNRWNEYKPHVMENIMPFGFGGRVCPGRKIALVEMKVVVCYLLLSYKIKLRENDKIRYDYNIGRVIKDKLGNVDFERL